VLRLIEEHPEHRLELPERDGLVADLCNVDLACDTLRDRAALQGSRTPWWNPDAECVNLKYADLRGAWLMDARLRGVDLGDAELQGALLGSADLQEAWVVSANLEKADLENAMLQQADLRHTNLEGAFLKGANLEGASLIEANLRQACLRGAKFRGVDLLDANLQGADLRYADLQELNLARCGELAGAFVQGARMGGSRLRREQLGEGIEEELVAEDASQGAEKRRRRYRAAIEGYVALRHLFENLSDYDAASWAYRKERRMRKKAAWQGARAAFAGHKWRESIESLGSFLGDQLVEWICDYGESWRRVLFWLGVVWLVWALLYGAMQGGWVPCSRPGCVRETTWNLAELALFSLGTMVTIVPTGMEANASFWMKLLMPLEALVAIFLTGLLGFVAGNRIRRS